MNGFSSVNSRMSSAIQLAITGTPADPSTVYASCEKGTCTFDLYWTLGVCSRLDIVPHDDISQTCPRDKFGHSVGCSYTVKELLDHPPWLTGNLTTGKDDVGNYPGHPPNTLWIGSSDIVLNPPSTYDYIYQFPNPETLTEFYVVYVANTTDYTEQRSSPELFSSIAAYKVGLEICAYQYNTTFINGETKTVQISQATNLKWAIIKKVIAQSEFSTVSSTIGGIDYWMEESTKIAFNSYLGLEVFRGASAGGAGWDVYGNVAPASDTPNTFASLLVNKPQIEGQDGFKATMDNLAVGMTNA